jgi:hypothetical protein
MQIGPHFAVYCRRGVFLLLLSVLIGALVAAASSPFVGLIVWTLKSPGPLPEIASDWRTVAEAKKHFGERVRTRFPPGTVSAAVAEELRKQGFSVDLAPGWGRSSAVLKRSPFPCGQTWSVEWSSDTNGLLTEVDGRLDVICL